MVSSGLVKSFLGQALGPSACRAGHRVRFIKVAKLLLALLQSRADNSFERELGAFLRALSNLVLYSALKGGIPRCRNIELGLRPIQ